MGADSSYGWQQLPQDSPSDWHPATEGRQTRRTGNYGQQLFIATIIVLFFFFQLIIATIAIAIGIAIIYSYNYCTDLSRPAVAV